jgi:SAM-dependent methyltransferase
MILKNIIQLIKAYKFSLLKVLVYEFLYILKGYKGNSININLNERITNNIPCPYLFLNQICKFIKKKRLSSMVDLGCGTGRSIFFFNKNYKINYFGIEFFKTTYLKCIKIFENNKNIVISNEDFMNFNFLKIENDCYFINDPLKKLDEFEVLINKILLINNERKKLVFFVLININQEKLKLFKEYELIDSLTLGIRGYYIFSNNKINE